MTFTQHIMTVGISIWIVLQDYDGLLSYLVAGALCPHWCQKWGLACHSPRLSIWAANIRQASCLSHFVSVWVLYIWKGFEGYTETKLKVFFLADILKHKFPEDGSLVISDMKIRPDIYIYSTVRANKICLTLRSLSAVQSEKDECQSKFFSV